MQCEERKTKPESIRKFLVQQVDEQSALCDVTVKMGHWEKKFHHCVLVASPFFDHVLNDNFLEKQTGQIKMTVGTPVTVEMAIMFLYGKKPKLTQSNIENMISLAEFLLIPNLKSACISWLKTVNITEENCMDILQLSSIYNFEIPTCEEYLLSHMLEILHHAQMVNLSKDSVQYLLSDRKLSYVPMDDKVTFLMRWANSQLARRKNYLRELFEEIDFHEVSKTVLDELKADQNASDEIDAEKLVFDLGNEMLQAHRVLIMRGESTDGTFWCLDLEKEEWFQLKSGEWRTSYMYYGELSSATDVGSEIYFKQRNYRQPSVLIFNLEEDVCKTYQFVHEGNGDIFREIDGVCITGDICIAYVNERVKTNKQTRQDTESINIQSRLRLMSLLAVHPMEQFLALKMIEGDNIRTNQYMETATLYMGHIQGNEIKLSPLLTFNDNKIAGMCINKMLTVAVIFGSREVVSLFDLVDYQMETMQLKTEYADKLFQSNDGFIIHNNIRCICLTRIAGPSLSSKYQTKEIQLASTGLIYDNKYIFCVNTWYHYYRRKRNGHFMFESATHNDMMSKSSIEDVTWKSLPLPKEETKCYSSTIKDNIFQISLPKHKLRCAIECPHCKPSIVRRTVVREYDVDDYYYNDSSDDEYYGTGYYVDDYGYYNDSD